jgi:hypothetical protein
MASSSVMRASGWHNASPNPSATKQASKAPRFSDLIRIVRKMEFDK